jgi:hypothetical protein
MLFQANTRSLAENTPLLPVIAFDAETAWVGPYCIPHQSACVKCFQLRRSANFSDDVFRPELLRIRPIDDPAPDFGPNPVHYIQAGIVANFLLESVALRNHGPSTMPGGLTTITINDAGVGRFRLDAYSACRVAPTVLQWRTQDSRKSGSTANLSKSQLKGQSDEHMDKHRGGSSGVAATIRSLRRNNASRVHETTRRRRHSCSLNWRPWHRQQPALRSARQHLQRRWVTRYDQRPTRCDRRDCGTLQRRLRTN